LDGARGGGGGIAVARSTSRPASKGGISTLKPELEELEIVLAGSGTREVSRMIAIET
jgi:hypothetical protein